MKKFIVKSFKIFGVVIALYIILYLVATIYAIRDGATSYWIPSANKATEEERIRLLEQSKKHIGIVTTGVGIKVLSSCPSRNIVYYPITLGKHRCHIPCPGIEDEHWCDSYIPY